MKACRPLINVKWHSWFFGLNNVLYISSCGLDAVRERGNNCAEVDRDACFLASAAFSTTKYAGTGGVASASPPSTTGDR